MGMLRRFLTRVDENVTHTIDRHLELAIPKQRSVSPDQVVRHLTPAGEQFQVLGYFSHCACCLKYTPQPCPVIHRTPCDRTECGQPEDVA